MGPVSGSGPPPKEVAICLQVCMSASVELQCWSSLHATRARSSKKPMHKLFLFFSLCLCISVSLSVY